MKHSGKVVSVGGVNWYVQQEGVGPVMLLVHGTGASGDSFLPLMPLLSEHFTLVIPDLPGHARSTVPPRFSADLPTFAAALDALLGALGVEPTYVVGHSAGAAVLVRMILDEMLSPKLMVGVAAALVPFQGLASVLFPSAARVLAMTSLAPEFIAARVTEEAVERVLRGTGSQPDRAAVARYQRLVEQPTHLAGVLSMLSRWEPSATFAQLSRLRAPLELIAGADDRAVPMEQTRQLLARAPHAQKKRPSLGRPLLRSCSPSWRSSRTGYGQRTTGVARGTP